MHQYLYKLLICVGFSFAVPLIAQSPLHLDLRSCIQYAEEHNYTLQRAALNTSTAAIQLKQERLQRAPSISAGVGQSVGYTHGNQGGASLRGNYSLNAGITLFNGLTIQNRIKQSTLQVDQVEQQVEQAKNQVRIAIIRAYLSVLMNQELLDYQENVLKSSAQQLQEGREQFKVGRILESDFLLLQSQYFSDSINIENTRITIHNDYLTLKNLLALPAEQSLTLVTPDSLHLAQMMVVPPLEEVLQATMAYLPELKIEHAAVDMAAYDVKIAKGNYYPQISMQAGVGSGYNAFYNNTSKGITSNLYDNLNESVSLNINIPIYQQGSVRNQVKMREIQYNQAQLSLKQVEQDVLKEVENYHIDIQKAHNDYRLSEVQQEAYYANYLAYSQKFQYGTITAVDLLQQQTNYLNIMHTFMHNKYNFLLQLKVLDVYMGKTVDL